MDFGVRRKVAPTYGVGRSRRICRSGRLCQTSDFALEFKPQLLSLGFRQPIRHLWKDDLINAGRPFVPWRRVSGGARFGEHLVQTPANLVRIGDADTWVAGRFVSEQITLRRAEKVRLLLALRQRVVRFQVVQGPRNSASRTVLFRERGRLARKGQSAPQSYPQRRACQ